MGWRRNTQVSTDTKYFCTSSPPTARKHQLDGWSCLLVVFSSAGDYFLWDICQVTTHIKNRSHLKIDTEVLRSRSSGRLQPSSAAAASLLSASSSSGGANFSFQSASPGSISQQPWAKISEKRELTATLRSSSSCLQPRTRRWRRCFRWSADHTST